MYILGRETKSLERYSPVRRASEGSAHSPDPCRTPTLQQEYQRLQRNVDRERQAHRLTISPSPPLSQTSPAAESLQPTNSALSPNSFHSSPNHHLTTKSYSPIPSSPSGGGSKFLSNGGQQSPNNLQLAHSGSQPYNLQSTSCPMTSSQSQSPIFGPSSTPLLGAPYYTHSSPFMASTSMPGM